MPHLRSTSTFLTTLLAISNLYLCCNALALNHTRLAEKRTVDHVTFQAALTRPFKRTIVAIGDLHDDYENTITALEISGVINGDKLWTGEVDVLVQIGDILDRGDAGFQIAKLFENIREAAKTSGGTVVSLYGNHEFMNLYGDWRLVTPEDIELNGGVEARQTTMRTAIGPINADYNPNDDLAYSALARQALSFTHGGYILGQPFEPYPSKINKIGRDIVTVLQESPANQPFTVMDLSYRTTLPWGITEQQEWVLKSENGPLWYRGFAKDEEKDVCKWIDRLLAQYGVKRIIVGHTVMLEGIKSRCEGKILLIDTGISAEIGGPVSAVKFEYSLTPICEETHTKQPIRKFLQRDVITALYKGRKNEILVEEQLELAIASAFESSSSCVLF